MKDTNLAWFIRAMLMDIQHLVDLTTTFSGRGYTLGDFRISDGEDVQ